jgi:hypothetical protein
MQTTTQLGGINPEALLDLVLEQIDSDRQMGDVEALYDFLDIIPRAQLIDYLSMTRQDRALEQGLIKEDEYTA